jgi:hypothetical protein
LENRQNYQNLGQLSKALLCPMKLSKLQPVIAVDTYRKYNPSSVLFFLQNTFSFRKIGKNFAEIFFSKKSRENFFRMRHLMTDACAPYADPEEKNQCSNSIN